MPAGAADYAVEVSADIHKGLRGECRWGLEGGQLPGGAGGTRWLW